MRYCYRHTVHFEETNLVGNVYFVNYARWQGHCREQFLLDHAPSVVRDLQKGSLALVTVSMSVDYLGETFAGDEVEVEMCQGPSTSRSRIHMDFRYLRSGELVATGQQAIACMERGDDGALRPVAPPSELLNALGRYA